MDGECRSFCERASKSAAKPQLLLLQAEWLACRCWPLGLACSGAGLEGGSFLWLLLQRPIFLAEWSGQPLLALQASLARAGLAGGSSA